MAHTDFPATWERKIYVITAVFTLFMVGLPVFVIGMGSYLHQIAPVIIGMLLLGIFAFGVSQAPRGYRLSADALRIKRVGTDVVIPLPEIARISLAEGKDVFRNAGRMSSSGGAFGIYGRFLGGFFPEFIVYATHTGRMVVIQRTHAIPIIISPDDAEGFVERCKALGVTVE